MMAGYRAPRCAPCARYMRNSLISLLRPVPRIVACGLQIMRSLYAQVLEDAQNAVAPRSGFDHPPYPPTHARATESRRMRNG